MRYDIMDIMQTSLGAMKMWARRLGMPLEKYLLNIQQGIKRCRKCKKWKQTNEFAKDTSRKDGLNTVCSICRRVKERKKPIFTLEQREAARKRLIGNTYNKGKKVSLEIRQHLRKIAIEQKRFCGEKSPQWKGGITPQNHIMRKNADYRRWRSEVFERDNYTCQNCGDNKGGNLEAHHLEPWENNKELRYIVNNGVTVCRDCHAKIHDKPDSYRKRKKQKQSLRLF